MVQKLLSSFDCSRIASLASKRSMFDTSVAASAGLVGGCFRCCDRRDMLSTPVGPIYIQRLLIVDLKGWSALHHQPVCLE
jgi:hypothetical protein